MTQVWTLLEGQRLGWQTVGDVRTLTSWRGPLFIYGSHSHSGLHPPILSVFESRHTQELVSSGVFSQDRHLSCCSGVPALYTFRGDVGEGKNFTCYVYLVLECRRGEKLFLFPLMFCTWGLQIKLMTVENNRRTELD